MAAVVGQPCVDDIRSLQAQVDQIQARLDFINPMMPFVNVMQDYYEKVECEASVQLMRLQKANARLFRQREANQDEVINAQLETVKWLHYMTDFVMALRDDLETSSSVSIGGGSCGTAATTAGNASSHVASSNNSNSSSSSTGAGCCSKFGGGPGGGGRVAAHGVIDLPSALSTSQQKLPPPLQQQLQHHQLPSRAADPAHRARPRSLGRVLSNPPAFGSGGSGGGGSSSSGATAAAKANDPELEWHALADPDGPAPLSGLVLGNGSWARAYWKAQGSRREALRLLCVSGIVTSRELSDDLTEISDAHIDECVSIATEMLQTWPLEVWAKQPDKANRYFEARLTALYERKVPNPA